MIEAEDLRFWPADADAPTLVVKRMSLSPGQVVAVLGSTGSGKSTLAAVLAGLAPRFLGGRLEGRLRINGVEVAACDRGTLMRTVGVVFQDPFSQISGAAETVAEEVAFGLENLGVPRAAMVLRVEGALARMGIADLAARRVTELSGGQMQKVAIASLLALAPPLMILDEPASQLDPAAASRLAGLAAALAAEGHLVLWTDVATHPVLTVAGEAWSLSEGPLPVAEALARAGALGLREPLTSTVARRLGVAADPRREAVLEAIKRAASG